MLRWDVGLIGFILICFSFSQVNYQFFSRFPVIWLPVECIPIRSRNLPAYFKSFSNLKVQLIAFTLTRFCNSLT